MSFELDHFLPYRLAVAAAQVSRRFAALYEAEAGLSIPEWRVLAHLAGSGPVSVRDINARVNLDKSVVSRAATRLEQAGLLCKSSDESDQRLVALELTDTGRALMDRLGRIADGFQAQLLAELGEDGPHLSRMLDRLLAPQGDPPR
ncbi:MAG: MarR family winged helix-turn-helix transcriptional regulator [Paracoccus aminovorans]|nr:MarR family winged helix-turn-helix transcriptional regulator [Paracoccus aminovorans]